MTIIDENHENGPCDSCSTARSLIQEALADDDYGGGVTFRLLSFRWDRKLSNEEIDALYHYETHECK